MSDTPQTPVPNTIENKAPKPPGLMPKNLQAIVVCGIALLMVLVMALTGHKRPRATAPSSPAQPTPLPVNQDKVANFQKDIEEKQRESAAQLEAALKQLAAQGQLQGQINQANTYGTPVTSANTSGMYPPGAYAAAPREAVPTQPPTPDPIKEEQKKRQYFSLFADNVALTYRKDTPTTQNSPQQSAAAIPHHSKPAPEGTAAADPFQTQDPFLAQQAQLLAQQQQLLLQAQQAGFVPQGPMAQTVPLATPPAKKAGEPPAAQPQTESPKEKPPNPDVPAPGALNSAEGKKYVLFEGTIIESLLINRLDGSFAGPVSCLVTNPVYSHDHQHILVPPGSKILGQASKVDAFGQVRLAVAFHRLIMPDGYSVSLDRFKGLDQEGATALKDKVNNHYLKIFGASMAIGILGAATQVGTGAALTTSGSDRVREGFGYGLGVSAERILDRFLNILPTVTIREGTRVKVYLSNDLLLPDYNAHTMPQNL